MTIRARSRKLRGEQPCLKVLNQVSTSAEATAECNLFQIALRLDQQFLCDCEATSKMLRESDLPIARIAHQTSFSDHAYFTRSFREKFGLFSSEYRKKIKLTQYLYKMSYFYIFFTLFVV